MENKVVSYELCKQLDELGFKCESHTGWWNAYFKTDEDIKNDNHHVCFYTEDDLQLGCRKHSTVGHKGDYYGIAYASREIRYKAFDCFDLLEWLKENRGGEITEPSYLSWVDAKTKVTDRVYRIWDYFTKELLVDTHPASALAQAVIEILKEKNNG